MVPPSMLGSSDVDEQTPAMVRASPIKPAASAGAEDALEPLTSLVADDLQA